MQITRNLQCHDSKSMNSAWAEQFTRAKPLTRGGSEQKGKILELDIVVLEVTRCLRLGIIHTGKDTVNADTFSTYAVWVEHT